MANTPIKPGTDNQKPGRYVEVGPRGGKVLMVIPQLSEKVIGSLRHLLKATVGKKSNLRLRTIVQWLYAFSIHKSTFPKNQFESMLRRNLSHCWHSELYNGESFYSFLLLSYLRSIMNGFIAKTLKFF
ncbi:Uncharacterised protein [Streptococcus pneumoniae]|nr:Uncharacterised protein [Streptococcus pneumoniae]